MATQDRHKAIPILFGYIADYESGRKFMVEEFINYFENVLAHLKLVRDQNNLDIVRGVDETLVSEFDRVPFTSPMGGTDIRYFSAHLLATAFPVLIPMSAQFQEAYRFCLKLRDKRADIDFMELELTSHLLDRNLLRKCGPLRYYFLNKIAEIQNLNHDPNILEEAAYQNLDRLATIPPSRLFLALQRRLLKKSSAEMIQDRQSPEYKLSEYKVFSKMADANPIHNELLFKMGYLKTKIPFWGRLKQLLTTFFHLIMGMFKAPRYLWFAASKSRGNFVFFFIALIIAVFFMIGVFKLLGEYNKKKFFEFNKKIEAVRQ